ncbi:MAG: hypothetical protein V5A25_04095, partial [Halovenus sp.]
MAETDRQYDLVVWGATGVAGRFVAEYLTEQYPPDELPIVVGDATEPESLIVISASRYRSLTTS